MAKTDETVTISRALSHVAYMYVRAYRSGAPIPIDVYAEFLRVSTIEGGTETELYEVARALLAFPVRDDN